jgi:hypothetical protein
MKVNNIVHLAQQNVISFVTVLFGKSLEECFYRDPHYMWSRCISCLVVCPCFPLTLWHICVSSFVSLDAVVWCVIQNSDCITWKTGEKILTHLEDCNDLFHLYNLLHNHLWILVFSWAGNPWSHHSVLQPACILNLPLPEFTCHYHFASAFCYPCFISKLYLLYTGCILKSV